MFPFGNLGVKLSLACFVLFVSSINGQNTLEKIEKQCWFVEIILRRNKKLLNLTHFNSRRQCDSHFSGADCWEKSFSYFSNHLLQSFVDYSNALQNVIILNKFFNYFLLKIFFSSHK